MLFTILVLGLAVVVPGLAAVFRLSVGMALGIALFAAASGAPGDALWALCVAGLGMLCIRLRRDFLAATA